MRYLRAAIGEGLLKIGEFDPCPAQYTIGYWEAVDGTLVATGHITSLPEAMLEAERADRVLLVMADGSSASVEITRRGAGSDWGEIDLCSPSLPLEPDRGNVLSLTGRQLARAHAARQNRNGSRRVGS
jgi:hypothetical protein